MRSEMTRPSISVVIPAHNGESFVHEAIESVLAQARLPEEVIICDDASTDGTLGILRGYGDQVRVLADDTNHGPGACRNHGAEAARGDYLAFIDADDRWMPEHLDEVARLLDQHESAAVAFSPVELFGARQGVWPNRIPCVGEPRNILIEMINLNTLTGK